MDYKEMIYGETRCPTCKRDFDCDSEDERMMMSKRVFDSQFWFMIAYVAVGIVIGYMVLPDYL